MKISEVTISDLKGYANCYHDMDDNLWTAILMGAKQFVVNYTGLVLADLDDHEDLTIALYVLANEMYDNRMVHVESNKIGFVIEQLLNAHSTNLL
ncbi:head-tail connector protein [Paenibacillus sp. OV219]|uniref:head-tail connector protein n=1 Tax=Paenibacillus sp. OV219 TaxID=1884377 RepID=UPI0008D61D85|nr:head-tail connector protein [Paenibacillus sp. OV219]SEN19058.1 Phage gp6-like head-tail connector protein [Paenibacillus sp. OV219]